MKFPIRRETLQTFDPVQEKKTREDIYIQNHINSLVREICAEIQSRMEWTMPTGAALHASIGCGNIEINRNQHNKIMSEKRFIWNELKYIRPGSKYGINVSEVSETVLIPLLVAKLKETFIGCDIIIDPLKTYLIVDWS
jgi:hypothetical protein